MVSPEATNPDRKRAARGDQCRLTSSLRFHDAENYLYKAPKGLNREIVEKIS